MKLPTDLNELRTLVLECVAEADADIVAEIRRNPANRTQLLSQLDSLEKVRSRINARIDTIGTSKRPAI